MREAERAVIGSVSTGRGQQADTRRSSSQTAAEMAGMRERREPRKTRGAGPPQGLGACSVKPVTSFK